MKTGFNNRCCSPTARPASSPNPFAAYRAAQGADPAVATVWSYGLLGALHFVTLWWLRDQESDMDLVIDGITSLLWSGMGRDSRPTTS